MAAPWPLPFSSWLLVLNSLKERNCGAFSVRSCFPQKVGKGERSLQIPLLVRRSIIQWALFLRWTQLGLSLWLQSGPQVTLAEEVARHKYHADSCLCALGSLLPSNLDPSSVFCLGPPLCGHRRVGAQCKPLSLQGRKMVLGSHADTFGVSLLEPAAGGWWALKADRRLNLCISASGYPARAAGL